MSIMTSTVRSLGFALGLSLTASAAAQTTQIGPSRFLVETGVTFDLAHVGNSHFRWTWTDSSGTFSGFDDPTIELAVGQTYIFQRTTSSHPFAICNDTLPVTGDDGSFERTTFSSAVILGATLAPAADFTADPAPTTDLISWTPTEAEIGEYFYTCTITGHPGMTGKLVVVAADEPCLADVNGNDVVDPGDFAAWVAAFNASGPGCDQNGDNACTPADFAAWVANFNNGC